MDQWLRVYTTPAENMTSVPTTPMRQLTISCDRSSTAPLLAPQYPYVPDKLTQRHII